ncbi:hypothetical protein QBC45DRAFT_390014 [Copromyces sp. CBS 386.78]|nr:hypothetical protein QBC45DRAFT_390014 [Copromyces sp. CBS 386.78]
MAIPGPNVDTHVDPLTKPLPPSPSTLPISAIHTPFDPNGDPLPLLSPSDEIQPLYHVLEDATVTEEDSLDSSPIVAVVDEGRPNGWNTLDTIHDFQDAVAHHHALESSKYVYREPTATPCEPPASKASKPNRPFQKWIKTLHKRAVRRQEAMGSEHASASYYFNVDGAGSTAWGPGHGRESSSTSSFGFVTAVKSASISLTSASTILTRSRRNTVRSSRGQSRTERSSRASLSGARLSEDSYCPERQLMVDPAAIGRSLQRRRVLEELIKTEESYIGDVRFLMNVYVTILASLPTLPASLRSSINRNLNDIVELHEEMLGDLHRAIPHSEYTQLNFPLQIPSASSGFRGHQRWRSLDAVPEDKDGISWLREVPGMLADPQVAAEVAKIFTKKMNRFFIYEEYGAKYELMIKDVASAHRTMPAWQSYQKGIEILASSLGSANSYDDKERKSLTIGDLLMKPIQRVCKYPLLFAELLKHTPEADCPYSHMEIENTLIRLREATAEINKATDDSKIKSTLEKTWILQDRLVFPNQQLDAASKNRVRSFGHIQLCGALHACWQTKEGVNGQYMVALLYKEWFCLAKASRTDQIYTIQACIALSNVKLEEVDNGRGLQCHTAPYSWKLVFLCDHQLYEIILTACTPKEEMEWRTRLGNQQTNEDQDQMQPATFGLLSLNIKTLGAVFRKPGTIARKISIHRATTVGPKSPLCQVILKNTSVIKDAPASGTSSSISRSQSLLTTNTRLPVLAPSREERARLEALLSDVWTRDILPFPGITARSRSEQLVRASASSMMRKLSVVSITSSFTKRSASLTSLPRKGGSGSNGTEDDTLVGSTPSKGTISTKALSRVCYNSEETSRSLLSVIPDKIERRSPMLRSASDSVGKEMVSVVRRLDRVRVRSDSETEGARRVHTDISGILQHSSGNSSRAPSIQQSNLSKQSSREMSVRRGKENNGSIADSDSVRGSGNSTSSGDSEYKASAPRPGRLRKRSKTSTSSMVGNKWQKVNVHREVVVQSLRNLFR